jgi:hypothetical protein
MIIRLDAANAGSLEAARDSVQALARSWDQEITEKPAEAAAAGTARPGEKVIDPVSIATLVLSIPPAALAVQDLADRIRKRRRARQLIDQAQQLSAQHVTLSLTLPGRTVELSGLTPDQLLDLLAGQEAAS